MALRSDISRSLQVFKQMKDNILPTNFEVVQHYFYLRKNLADSDSKFSSKTPSFSDLKDSVVNDVIAVWSKASLPTVSRQRVVGQSRNLISKFEAARKRAKRRKSSEVSEEWLQNLFDISKCKCPIEESPKIRSNKLLCSCDFKDRIPEKEITFIKDQRSERKMVISHVDISYGAAQIERLAHIRTTPDDSEDTSPRGSLGNCSGSAANETGINSLLTSTRLRKRSSAALALPEEDEENDAEIDSEYCPRKVSGGKNYKKNKSFFVTEQSCILADRRMTSLRQQSDQLLSVIGADNIAASSSTVYRHREKARMKALQQCESVLSSSNSIQLCYDGKIIDKIDRYVFVGQFIDSCNTKVDEVMGVKSFCKNASVTGECLFNAISEVCAGCLHNVYSVMADTTALNTGKTSGVNKRLQDHIRDIAGHGIHELECMFHVNEVYLTHVITAVEGSTKGPGAMQDGAIMNVIKTIDTPVIESLAPQHSFQVPVTRMAALHVKAKLEWFSQQKRQGNADNSLRSDQLCTLVLAGYIVAEVPDNLKNLLVYKQERICHSRWVTTANGYLRMLIFNIGNLSNLQRKRLNKIVSFILSVYLPSFIMIHLNPKAAEGPSLTLFQRDLILAYRQLEPDIADVVWKYFVPHASKWLSPVNVALSVYAEIPPYSLEAVSSSESFSDSVDIGTLLSDPKQRLRHFFTKQSKEAPCISASHLNHSFWRTIDCHNRSTERRIGILKEIINKKIFDAPKYMNRTDIRLRAYMCNLDLKL